MSVDGLVAATQAYLASKTDITDLLGDTDGDPWIFQRTLAKRLEGTSEAAIVVAYAGQSSSPNRHNTDLFCKLSIAIWVDVNRDSGGNSTDPTGAEAESRALEIWNAVDGYLHRVSGGVQQWGDVYSISSTRLTALGRTYNVPEGDGLIRGEAFYSIEIG